VLYIAVGYLNSNESRRSGKIAGALILEQELLDIEYGVTVMSKGPYSIRNGEKCTRI
jgi:hypothetical protein